MIISTYAFARAGLLGNPSDGYFGKTISFAIRDFRAEVRLWESPHFEISPGSGDLAKYADIQQFLRDSKLTGYYGGMRLIKATIRRFHDFFASESKKLADRGNFSLTFESNIPRLVGLAGSSAIIVATLRALSKFYDIAISQEELPTLALSVETKELGLAAGLQDRVAQTYEGLVYMDFERERVERTGAGKYESLKPPKPLQLYVAYNAARAEASNVPDRNLRKAWDDGASDVHDAMARLAELAAEGRKAIFDFNVSKLHDLTNENYDIRKRIMPSSPENEKMVQTARESGASANFAGSGGAICGVFTDALQYQRLLGAMQGIGCEVFQPKIFEK